MTRVLMWLGLGAAAMYLFDPDQGRRRRALAQDKLTRARRLIRERASAKASTLDSREPEETPAGAHHLGR